MKTKICPGNQTSRFTCLTLITNSSTSLTTCSVINSTKGLSFGFDFSTIGASTRILTWVVKTSNACKVVSMIIILTPTLIWNITNGTALGVTGVYKSLTWVFATMVGASCTFGSSMASSHLYWHLIVVTID